jgi:hypothetical protein
METGKQERKTGRAKERKTGSIKIAFINIFVEKRKR